MRKVFQQFALTPAYYRVFKDAYGVLHAQESKEDPTLSCVLEVGELDLSDEEQELFLLTVIATLIGVSYV